MTTYEELNRKLELLKEAEVRCIQHGRMPMAFAWRLHQIRLQEKIWSMTVEEAMKWVAC